MQTNGSCKSVSTSVEDASCNCTTTDGQYYFTKTMVRSDNTLWRWRWSTPDSKANSTTVNVTVVYQARIVHLTVDGYGGLKPRFLQEHQSVRVECQWENGNPPVNGQLLSRHNKPLNNSANSGVMTYTFPSVNCDDAGIIQCLAPGSHYNMSSTLLITCPPEFVNTSNVFHKVTYGQPVVLRFQVRTHTSVLTYCNLHQYSGKINFTSADALQGLLNCAIDFSESISVFPQERKGKCKCFMRGEAPAFSLILTIFYVTATASGPLRVTVANNIGSDHIDVFLVTVNVTPYINNLNSTPWMSSDKTNHLGKAEMTEESTIVNGDVILVMGIMTGVALIIAMSIAGVKLNRRIGTMESLDTTGEHDDYAVQENVAENFKPGANFKFHKFINANNVLNAQENVTINVTFSLIKVGCRDLEDLVINIDKLKPDEKRYTYLCTIMQTNGSCKSVSKSVEDASCNCTTTDGQYYFTKTMVRSDNTLWRWKWSTPDSKANSTTVNVIVLYQARIIHLTVDGYGGLKPRFLQEHQSVRVECQWENGNPPVTGQLLSRHNKPLNNSANSGVMTYTFPSVNCDDAGIIQCLAPGSHYNMSTTLLITCPPEFVNTSNVLHKVTYGQPVVLHFQVRTHTAVLTYCNLHQYSGKINFTSADALQGLLNCAIDFSESISVFSQEHKGKCKCFLRGEAPTFSLILTIFYVTATASGPLRVTVANSIGSDHINVILITVNETITTDFPSRTLSLHKVETSGSEINSSTLISVGTIATIASVLVIIISALFIKQKCKMVALEINSQNTIESTPKEIPNFHTITEQVTPMTQEFKLNQTLKPASELGCIPEASCTTPVFSKPGTTHESNEREPSVRWLCEKADVMKVVFYVKGQPYGPNNAKIRNTLESENTSYLTPTATAHSLQESEIGIDENKNSRYDTVTEYVTQEYDASDLSEKNCISSIGDTISGDERNAGLPASRKYEVNHLMQDVKNSQSDCNACMKSNVEIKNAYDYIYTTID